MSGVFLDSVGLLALWDSSDQWNHAAGEAHRRMIAADAPLWTTTRILIECGTGLPDGQTSARWWLISRRKRGLASNLRGASPRFHLRCQDPLAHPAACRDSKELAHDSISRYHLYNNGGRFSRCRSD
jgi:hypothetical protein